MLELSNGYPILKAIMYELSLESINPKRFMSTNEVRMHGNNI